MEVFDRERALRRIGGDEERLKIVMKEFLQDVDRRMTSLEVALRKRDRAELERLARALERETGELGASGMEAVSSRLAEAGARRDWSEAESFFRKLEMELEWLKRVLDETICSGNL